MDTVRGRPMTRPRPTLALGIVSLACVGSLQAHHSDRMIDGSTAVRLTGTVLRYEPINPHAMIFLAVATEDGQLRTWTIEGPRLASGRIRTGRRHRAGW